MGPNRYLHFIICFVYYCLELPLIKYALKTILPPVSILLHISFALLWQTTHKSGKPRSSIVKTFKSPLDIHNCIRLIVVKLRGPNRYLHLRKCFVWNCCLKLLLKKYALKTNLSCCPPRGILQTKKREIPNVLCLPISIVLFWEACRLNLFTLVTQCLGTDYRLHFTLYLEIFRGI